MPSLVYANTPHGAVLVAAMYLLPRSAGDADLPRPGGCLSQWHLHTDLCFRGGVVVDIAYGGTCPADSVNHVTPPMLHIWLAPVAGGPLATDPGAWAEVDAASRLPALSRPNGTA